MCIRDRYMGHISTMKSFLSGKLQTDNSLSPLKSRTRDSRIVIEHGDGLYYTGTNPSPKIRRKYIPVYTEGNDPDVHRETFTYSLPLGTPRKKSGILHSRDHSRDHLPAAIESKLGARTFVNRSAQKLPDSPEPSILKAGAGDLPKLSNLKFGTTESLPILPKSKESAILNETKSRYLNLTYSAKIKVKTKVVVTDPKARPYFFPVVKIK
eukprot:TRINITY_DN1158_c0_g3_i1.p1 TRINITY_DN1158_c0_g3~~TRINITY_DN1158_c0_g3_i1.p1  ORF type:complete len:230 (+),score=20.41 TRINITY_DN1158_c0_g3_i1:61-690(+)